MTTGMQKSTQDQLKRLIEQIERLESEKKGIAEDISDKMKEAKSQGFDTKIIRQVLRMRKVTQTEREEAQAVLDVYLAALGMLADTPLGQAAIDRETKVRKIARSHGISDDVADQVAAEV